jgi:hypothetical protein
MVTTTLLRFIAAMTVAAVAASAPAPALATSDRLTIMAAPRWIDQTIYQPNCPSIECDCGCHLPSYCEPDCGRW